jgi:hypothetical protein
MNRTGRKISIVAALLLAATMAFAQSGAASKSVSIRIVAIVPPILNLSLDFATGSSISLAGYLPGPETNESNAGFQIASGSVVELGNARIFSNLLKSYSVSVFSANGGNMRCESDDSSIPYSLKFGDAEVSACGGTFNFEKSGKSSKSGTPMAVALAFANVPSSLTNGAYTDNLMFSIAAN